MAAVSQYVVLVVADDPVVRRGLAKALEPELFRVRVAHGISDALELVREEAPDVIVLDLLRASEDAGSI